jgi:CDP-glycerol glycerophosphotransferase
MRLKKIEKDTSHELPFIYKLFAKIDSYQLDYILSGSEFSTEIIKRAFGVKNAAILEYGTPRNDILFNADMEFKRYLVKKINITSQIRKIILYAPTFRRNFNTDIYQIDYEKIIYAFETLFGEKCILLLRLHPSFPIGHKLSAMSEYVIDVTDYQDIQELLCISDVLITDYSSCMFDFSLLYRPCFLYVPDISTYDRGTYLQIDELPFPHATNMDEFYAAVVHFNLEDYKQRNRLFIEQKIHSFENGNATENVCNRLIQHLK